MAMAMPGASSVCASELALVSDLGSQWPSGWESAVPMAMPGAPLVCASVWGFALGSDLGSRWPSA